MTNPYDEPEMPPPTDPRIIERVEAARRTAKMLIELSRQPEARKDEDDGRQQQ
jgi:hypothetical protein